jgi:hypothetical protein
MTNFASNSSLRKIIINAPVVNRVTNWFSGMPQLEYVEVISSIENLNTFTNMAYSCYCLSVLKLKYWKQGDLPLSSSLKLSVESIKYIIWYALNGANTLGFENQGATSRILQLHATPYASLEEWKLTKPSVEDCKYLGIDETEITKYGELTWEDIALNVKLITIAK